MKPMLAAPTTGEDLTYPLLLSGKLDGVRCIIKGGVAMSRSLKPIPNQHVQKLFGRYALNGLDGELIVGPPAAKDVYRKTVSGVMSEDGEPKVTFYVFDNYLVPGDFVARFAATKGCARGQKHVQLVPHHEVDELASLLNYEVLYLEDGYEGVMLRHPYGPYKHGRSTLKEAYLLKLKRFVDAEAEILGTTELMQNTNVAERNELGNLERSHKKAGMRGTRTLGALVVRDLKTNVEFEVGTGFTAADREVLWADRDNLYKQVVKYKSQPIGVKDKPRFPVFLGFRDRRDM